MYFTGQDGGEFPKQMIRWGGTLLLQAIGRAMEWPEPFAWELPAVLPLKMPLPSMTPSVKKQISQTRRSG